MSGRSGPFWDGVEGRAPMPRAAATLGFEFIEADVEAGTIELAFLEASLVGADAAVIATATATARVIALRHARAAA
jgi:hypothetical protein